MDSSIKPASENDIPDLVALVNSAYRGETSKKGWTTEADLLGGIRTDKEGIRDLITKPGSVVLKYLSANHQIIGCVHLQKAANKMYLGMLTVSPFVQNEGIGKQLLHASELYAHSVECTAIMMTVISVRYELIAWYKRRGYELTGERKPFPSGNPRFGLPKRELEFVVLEKDLSLVGSTSISEDE